MSTSADRGRRPTPRPGKLPAGGPTARAELAAEQIAALAETAEPGSRLGTKDELRALCNVSVGTLNETLRLLQSRGIITVRPGPGGGIFTAEQSPMVRLGNSVLALDSHQTDVSDALRIREALEPLLIEDALWHASPADIALLREQLAAMEAAVTVNDLPAFKQANWRLHALIADISPSELLRSLYTNLLDLVESHTVSILPGEEPLADYLSKRYAIHRDLVDALDRRDRPAALHLIDTHNAPTPD